MFRIGDQIHRWTILKDLGTGKNYHRRFLCLCTCGNLRPVLQTHLKRGVSKSCGCFSLEKLKQRATHGMSKTVEFKAWQRIKDRCYNKNNERYINYGGRGIVVCDRWLESFENFYRDMGKRPEDKTSIDRIDNDGNYEPENCRWADAYQQMNNTTRTNKRANND